MEKKQPLEMVKFYADCKERGVVNKQFNYRTHDVSHSTDILNKFVANGYKIRMAWHHLEDGRQIKLKVILPQIDGDTTGSYNNLKKLNRSLKTPTL
jgi:hypothetical protein